MIKILHVDDEPALVEITKLYLEKGGDFEVTTAISAPDALAILKTGQFDAIISDYEMPGMDGIEFLKKLREKDNITPFIIFSGRGREDVLIDAINNGADFYLQKGGKPKSQFAELKNMIFQSVKRKNAENALRESEERYRAVVESQTELICRFLPDGTIKFANDAFCRYYNIKYEDLVGNFFKPSVPAGEREKIVSHFNMLTPKSPYGAIEHPIIMPDGSIRWQHWIDRAFFDENDKLIEFQSVGRDVTEERLMRDSLQEKVNYVQALMDTIPAPVFYRDTKGVYYDCNRAFEELVDLSRDEIIGKNIYDFFDEELADVYTRKDREIIENPYLQQYEYAINNSCGEIIDVLFSKTALFAADGSVAGIVGVILDISDRKEMEKALRENEEKFRTLADYTYDWESWIGPDGKFIYMSPSCKRTTGYDAKEFLADPFVMIEKIVYPDDKQMVIDHYSGIDESYTGVSHFDFRIITASGDLKWLSHYCQPVYHDDGRWAGRRETKRDITLRKEFEEKLSKVNEKLNLLSNVTRHDVLNQVTALIGYLEILRGMTEEDPSVGEIIGKIEMIATTVQHQISFTEDYQEIGIYSPAWQNLENTVDLSIFMQDVERLSVVDVEIDSDLEVYADPLLNKVFYNFIDNSLHHGGPNLSSVKFSVEKTKKSLKIIYEDDGEGIPDDDKERIFLKGFGKNTGYGLFLIVYVLSITGMSIKECGKYGEGVRFEILVPEDKFRFV